MPVKSLPIKNIEKISPNKHKITPIAYISKVTYNNQKNYHKHRSTAIKIG